MLREFEGCSRFSQLKSFYLESFSAVDYVEVFQNGPCSEPLPPALFLLQKGLFHDILDFDRMLGTVLRILTKSLVWIKLFSIDKGDN